MNQNNPPVVPDGFYVSFHSGPPACRNYAPDAFSGECIIRVYKSLDHGFGHPPVEHVVDIAGFRIKARGRDAEEFLVELASRLEEIAGKYYEAKKSL